MFHLRLNYSLRLQKSLRDYFTHTIVCKVELRRFVRTVYQALLLCLLFWPISPALSQNIPASVEPSRVEKQFVPPPRPKIENYILQQPSTQELLSAPAGAEDYTFILNELLVDGVSAYPSSTIKKYAAGMIGKEVTVEDVYKLAERITKHYQDAGYILTRAVVPAQEIEGGVIKISVVEGYIYDIELTGKDIPSFPTQKIVNEIRENRPLNIHELERKLLVLDELPGFDIKAVLAPLNEKEAADNPGAVRLNIMFTLNVSLIPESVSGTASVDNYGSKFIGPWQAGLRTTIPHEQLFLGETSISIFATPTWDELAYFALAEHVPITSDGLYMNAAFKYSRSEPGSSLEELDLYSRYLSFSLGLDYPIILSRQRRWDVSGSFEANTFTSDILSDRLYEDKTRVLRLGSRYQGSHNLGGLTFGNLNFSQGFDILGARETGSADLSREEGHSDFSKFEFSLTHNQELNSDFGLSVNVTGQYSFSPLLSSEEFGYGGYALGRAYDNSEIAGDSGLGFLAELSYRKFLISPENSLMPSIEPYIFYDIGKVWNLDSNTEDESGASSGGGFRFRWENGSIINTTIAQPLTRSIENPKSGNGRNPRFLLSLQHNF